MKKRISTIIVDDEQEAVDYLSILLQECCPEVDIVATSTDSSDALRKIFRLHPDLLFLDIKIDGKDGFDIVRELENANHKPYIIFVTAFSKYAVDAFKTNAIAYLLKPVGPDDLDQAINQFKERKGNDLLKTDFLHLLTHFQPKIRFNTRTGFILLSMSEIVYCESDGNYTLLHLQDHSRKLVSLNLGNTLKQLSNPKFKRISRYHIINEDYLAEVDRSKLECILSINGERITVKFSPRFMNGF